MLDGWRKFFQTKAGYAVAGVLVALGLLAVLMTFKSTFGTTDAESFTSDRPFIDAETGKPFNYELKIGDTIPVTAPSGKKTGYPAEKCFWTRDGKTKTQPTLVLLNSYKGGKEPTFCPDCGRLVRGHNPAPTEGAKPPPTQQEYKGR